MESNIRRNGPRQAAALMLRFESAPEEDTAARVDSTAWKWWLCRAPTKCDLEKRQTEILASSGDWNERSMIVSRESTPRSAIFRKISQILYCNYGRGNDSNLFSAMLLLLPRVFSNPANWKLPIITYRVQHVFVLAFPKFDIKVVSFKNRAEKDTQCNKKNVAASEISEVSPCFACTKITKTEGIKSKWIASTRTCVFVKIF